MLGLEEQLDVWAKGYLDGERLPCLAVAVIQGNQAGVSLLRQYTQAIQCNPSVLNAAHWQHRWLIFCLSAHFAR